MAVEAGPARQILSTLSNAVYLGLIRDGNKTREGVQRLGIGIPVSAARIPLTSSGNDLCLDVCRGDLSTHAVVRMAVE
jgi:hypothetical protein